MSINLLQGSLQEYMQRLRKKICIDVFLDELAGLGECAIFGGMIRDFGLKIPFESDIDIVSMASADELLEVARVFSPVRNRFGGLRFSCCDVDFDLWSLQDTWAIQQGVVDFNAEKGMRVLLDTTFFSIDAAIFNVATGDLYLSKGCEDDLRCRRLEINLEDHPDPKKMLLRAKIFAEEKNLRLGPKLERFVTTFDA